MCSEDFDAWFSNRDQTDPDAVVKQLHKVLRPFLLRRVKADVEHSLLPKKEINLYVGMTEMQRKWYRMLLEKDIDAVNGMRLHFFTRVVADDQVPPVKRKERPDYSISSCSCENVVITLIVRFSRIILRQI
jgi:SNF2 family DNA or RNA helicase